MSDKLLPCPFCGDEDIEVERVGTSRHSCVVACTNCGVRIESGEDGFGSAWNTRAPQAASSEIGDEAGTLDADPQVLIAAGKAIEQLESDIKFLLSFAPKGKVPIGLEPTSYISLSYGGDMVIQERVNLIREKNTPTTDKEKL